MIPACISDTRRLFSGDAPHFGAKAMLNNFIFAVVALFGAALNTLFLPSNPVIAATLGAVLATLILLRCLRVARTTAFSFVVVAAAFPLAMEVTGAFAVWNSALHAIVR